jgi:hypothetical protein
MAAGVVKRKGICDINNVGIMRPENLKTTPDDLSDAEAIITTDHHHQPAGSDPPKRRPAVQKEPEKPCFSNLVLAFRRMRHLK